MAATVTANAINEVAQRLGFIGFGISAVFVSAIYPLPHSGRRRLLLQVYTAVLAALFLWFVPTFMRAGYDAIDIAFMLGASALIFAITLCFTTFCESCTRGHNQQSALDAYPALPTLRRSVATPSMTNSATPNCRTSRRCPQFLGFDPAAVRHRRGQPKLAGKRKGRPGATSAVAFPERRRDAPQVPSGRSSTFPLRVNGRMTWDGPRSS